MVSKVAFEKNGIEWMRLHPTGTGPFIIESYQPDVSVKGVRNPDYWIKGKPYLDSIEYKCVVDLTTQKLAMQTGEVDRTSLADPGIIAKGYADMGLDVIAKIDSDHFLVPDSANAQSPWANQKVREALEYAIDREAIASAFGYGYLKAPYQIPSRDSLAYNPNFTLGRKFDAARARQLLSDAGFSAGFETTIIVAPMGLSNNRNIPTAVQANLADVGIKASIEFPDMGGFSTHMEPVPGRKALYYVYPYPWKMSSLPEVYPLLLILLEKAGLSLLN